MKEHVDLIKTVVDAYLQPKLWQVPLSVTGQEDTASSIPEAQSNIVQVFNAICTVILLILLQV